MSKPNFCKMFFMFLLQKEIVFIKWEQNHRLPDRIYINNDDIDVVIL